MSRSRRNRSAIDVAGPSETVKVSRRRKDGKEGAGGRGLVFLIEGLQGTIQRKSRFPSITPWLEIVWHSDSATCSDSPRNGTGYVRLLHVKAMMPKSVMTTRSKARLLISVFHLHPAATTCPALPMHAM